MKTRLKVAWKVAVAGGMIWVAGKAFGVDFDAIPFWRVAAGFTALTVAFSYVMAAAEVEDEQEA